MVIVRVFIAELTFLCHSDVNGLEHFLVGDLGITFSEMYVLTYFPKGIIVPRHHHLRSFWSLRKNVRWSWSSHYQTFWQGT